MNELRESIRSLGIAEPETAVAVHAVTGADPALLPADGRLPQRFDDLGAWLRAEFLDPGSPHFETHAGRAAALLGEEPDEDADAVLALAVLRPRTLYDMRAGTRLSEDALAAVLPRLEAAGLLTPAPNPLAPDDPFWTFTDRLARFHYAVVRPQLPRWRRGYITDKLWTINRARFDRYVARPEFLDLAREHVLADTGAASVTRITVPDPRYRQLRTLELAAWDDKGAPIALGTARWRFKMVERQLKRLRYVKRLLGDPDVRLYCVASRFEPGITGDPDPALRVVDAARVLADPAPEPEADAGAETPPDRD
ncbi:hypothetical protein [Glycomyces terrestris]|uniref:Uncharacterized protein n=1 Tax=Glycomyces terrestris TaxID=2493553 RepID=A0A426V4Y2_9ACTN|nr:hypothetical protein [Glycomyces terrestris]RRS01895.1 hypothetical protein EIW28_03890 [Glycomyces terrestris]